MRYLAARDGFTLETAAYAARFKAGRIPRLLVERERERVFDLPAVSGMAAVDRCETLGEIAAGPVKARGDKVELSLSARSDLWRDRTFRWTFSEQGIEYEHSAGGGCRPGRVYFFSNGSASGGPSDAPRGAGFGATIHAARTFSPAANMADEYERMIGIPLSLGILPEVETPFAYGVPDRTAMIFAPPPLCLMFGGADRWAGIGIGARPGDCRFNALEYSGQSHSGAFFHVNYLGYAAFEGFRSPRAVIRFGYSPWETLEQYMRWMDAGGFTTSRGRDVPLWHRLPIFCGWGEQCRDAGRRRGRAARDFCEQPRYEEWIAALEKRGLPFGTVVIDDKWQAAYGSFDVDARKWPDMAGFVRRQHRNGRRVLLWIPVYHSEGVPESMCVQNEDGRRYADVSNPAYERFLRRKIRHLVRKVGVDGFKVDWVWGVTRRPGLKTHAPLHGIEWLRRFQSAVYDEAHRWKPDAMVETHSANPLFRSCSDVLRLNDLHGGARRIAAAMAARARIARIAGWPVVDCDASSGSIAEWWDYMLAQPSIGTPALYFADRTGAGPEAVPKWMWESLAVLWREYCRQVEASHGATTAPTPR